MSSEKVNQILNNNNWQYSQFNKLNHLVLGESLYEGMGSDYNGTSIMSYTVPSGRRLICYQKVAYPYIMWAEGGTGYYEKMNGVWQCSGWNWYSGSTAMYPLYVKQMPNYGSLRESNEVPRYLFSFNGNRTFQGQQLNWGFCWAIVSDDYSEDDVCYNILIESVGYASAYAKNSSADANTISMSKLSGPSGYPPTFYYYGNTSYYGNPKLTITDTNGKNSNIEVTRWDDNDGNRIKEEYAAGETITKSGTPGTVDMSVLLLNDKGEPVEFVQPTYSNDDH